jgi:hypothetical protein
MIQHVADKSRVGVCLDTCHMFAAGYDVSTAEGYADTMARFGEIVGFDKLKGGAGGCRPLCLHMHLALHSHEAGQCSGFAQDC